MSIKRFITTIIAALIAASPGVLAAPAQASGTSCQQTKTPVTLSATDPTIYQVAGWLCANGSPAGKTLQLLVHGLTYDHQYWDWPQSPQTYSYTRSATDAGYATFSIDRLGDGISDHPIDGNSVTAISGAYVLHQIVQGLRAGTIGQTAFAKVITVGHSYGSITSAYEAATYHDVDGTILSGFLHDSTPASFTAVTNDFYPATSDPKFANSGLNSTYLTTVPGTRTPLFFDTANASQAVITEDEALKQTGTTGETNTFAAAGPLTPQISVPVLLVMGDNDYLFCDPASGLSCANKNAILARESSHFSPQARLEAYVQPNSGHDLNLHKNAHLWFESATSWANRHFGCDAHHPATQS
jgi:pimeloyl-ACP methyl ester carboxylesterase